MTPSNEDMSATLSDAPEGMSWKCPACGSMATLGDNAMFHRDSKRHPQPTLVPRARKWTVCFVYCQRRFTSEPMPREIAEQVQDGIEKELGANAWLDPITH